jgi:hypothetical protein
MIAMAAAAPAIMAPRFVAVAQAQLEGEAPATADRAEYPDVPRGHWAYEAIDRLSKAGIIEGMPNGTYMGQKPMTRYEFAVAIARLLDKLPRGGGGGERGERGERGETGARGADAVLPDDLVRRGEIADFVRRAELNDLIAALRREFADELSRLGVRVGAVEDRVTALENRVPKPPRLTITPSILHRTGTANYIDNEFGGRLDGGGNGLPDEGFFEGEADASSNFLFDPAYDLTDDNDSAGDKKFSYTDFELRLTDRVTDRLSVNAAIRSISGTVEDPWLFGTRVSFNGGEPTLTNGVDGGFWLREGYAVANLSDRRILGARGLNLILGRQRTKVAQGLLYDNDFSPTDQLHGQFNLGPVQVNAFIGTNNNVDFLAGTDQANVNPYLNAGAANYMGGSAGFNGNFFGVGSDAFTSGAGVGFPDPFAVDTPYTDDNEALIRGGINLFRISGNPVMLGASYHWSGVQNQRGHGFDLTLPLFNRTVGIEYVKQSEYANGEESDGHAYNITVPLLRARWLDLDFAYGKANDDFEFFLSSAANPFARTYGEALFDRPLALGAPMVNGDGEPGDPQFMAAKKVYDIKGTLRLLRRLPIDWRYYKAKGTDNRDLGHVWSVGSTFNLTPGLDVELKYGQYAPEGGFDKIKYFRVGANVGF